MLLGIAKRFSLLNFKFGRRAVTLLVAMWLIGSASAVYLIFVQEVERPDESNDGVAYKIDVLQKNLEHLFLYVENQKRQIATQEKMLAQLSAEKEELEPVVKAQRTLVSKILELEHERYQSRQWLEAGMGFLLGVISSLLASAMWDSYRKRKPQD